MTPNATDPLIIRFLYSRHKIINPPILWHDVVYGRHDDDLSILSRYVGYDCIYVQSIDTVIIVQHNFRSKIVLKSREKEI